MLLTFCNLVAKVCDVICTSVQAVGVHHADELTSPWVGNVAMAHRICWWSTRKVDDSHHVTVAKIGERVSDVEQVGNEVVFAVDSHSHKRHPLSALVGRFGGTATSVCNSKLCFVIFVTSTVHV